MNTPYFNTDARRASLIFVAGKWKETPWCPNSMAQGKRGGVSCHNLPREIYIECGALREDFPKIIGMPAEATESNIMESLLDSRKEFMRLKDGDKLQPGDLIGLWLVRDDNGRRVRARHTNHLGVILDNFWFVHVLTHKATDFDLHNVSPWLERIISAWRPVEQPSAI